jgi:hypothetical protein
MLESKLRKNVIRKAVQLKSDLLQAVKPVYNVKVRGQGGIM